VLPAPPQPATASIAKAAAAATQIRPNLNIWTRLSAECHS
jgi:hypothetical protein